MDLEQPQSPPSALKYRLIAAWPIIALTVLFAISRAVFFASGVRFYADTINTFWQYLDPEVLRRHLLAGLYTLHSQPPLFNLFLGIILKLFPQHYVAAFQVLFMVFGYGLCLLSYGLLRQLGACRGLAFILSGIYAISPEFILYENLLFYTMPLAALTALCAAAYGRLLESFSRGWLLTLFLCLFALCAMRSLFHPIFFVAVTAVTAWSLREHWRTVAAYAVVPFLLLMGWNLKNYILVGRFEASTWFGISFATLMTNNMPMEERQRLVHESVLSEFALIKPFSRLDEYPAEYRETLGLEQYPWLHTPLKSTGMRNFNNLAYMRISEMYGRDAFKLLIRRPDVYLRSAALAWIAWCEPPTRIDWLFDTNRQHMGPYYEFFDRYLYGRLNRATVTEHTLVHYYVFLIAGLFVSLAAAVIMALRGMSSADPVVRRRAMHALFLAFIIMFVGAVSNFTVLWENNRFRFKTDALQLALVGYIIHNIWLYARNKRESRLPPNR